METTTIQTEAFSKNWGLGWSNSPNTEVTTPNYIGTLTQIGEAKKQDPIYQSMVSGNIQMETSWFYKGKKVVQSYISWVQTPDDLPFPENMTDDSYEEWSRENKKHLDENSQNISGWVDGCQFERGWRPSIVRVLLDS